METKSKIEPVKPAISTPSQIIKISPIRTGQPKLEPDNSKQSVENFLSAAKSLEPLVDKISGIISGASAKVVDIAATNILQDEEAAGKLAKKVEFSEASREGLKTAGARIIARRVQNEEVLDWVVIATAFGEMGLGWTMVARELMVIRKLKEKAALLEQKTPQN